MTWFSSFCSCSEFRSKLILLLNWYITHDELLRYMNFFRSCSHVENFFMTHKITLDSACFPEHISWIRRVFQNTFPCVLCVAIDQRIWMVIQTILSPLPPSRHWCFNSEVISFVSYHRRYSLHISDIIDHNDEGTCRIMTKGHVEFLNHKLKGKSNSKSIFLQILELLWLEVDCMLAFEC